jgi:hypothetical protein
MIYFCEEDQLVLEALCENILIERNPTALLSGKNRLLVRFYARSLVRYFSAERRSQVYVHRCQSSQKIHEFMSYVCEDLSNEEAVLNNAKKWLRLILFLNTDQLRPEELRFLKHLQQSFPALNLAYLFEGGSDFISLVDARVYSFNENENKKRVEKLQFAPVSPTRRKSLSRMFAF